MCVCVCVCATGNMSSFSVAIASEGEEKAIALWSFAAFFFTLSQTKLFPLATSSPGPIPTALFSVSALIRCCLTVSGGALEREREREREEREEIGTNLVCLSLISLSLILSLYHTQAELMDAVRSLTFSLRPHARPFRLKSEP